MTRRQHLGAVAIFVAVLVVVFYRAIFCGEVLAPLDLLTRELPWRGVVPMTARLTNPALADVLAVFQPWKEFVHAELRAGRFPLWCTQVGCGYPLAGAGDLKLFGLTTLFLAIAPVAVATWMSFFSQLLIAMTGMYWLLVALRRRWLAAVLGGLVFGLNSALFQHLEFEHIVGGLMMLPWICWALRRGAEERRFIPLAGVFLGFALLNGSVQSFAMVWMSSAAFAGLVLRRRAVGVVVLATLIGLAVGAVALLPNLELIRHNVRVRYEHLDWRGMLWKRPVAMGAWFAAFFNPDVLGNSQTFDLTRALGSIGMVGRTASVTDLRIYGGLLAALLAVLGLRGRSEVRTLGLWMIGVPVVMVAVVPLYLIVYFRYLAATALGLGMLAALGLERILAGDEKLARDVRRLLVALAIVVVAALATGVFVTGKQALLTEKIQRAGAQGTSFYRADKNLLTEKTHATVANFTWHGAAVARFAGVAVLAGLLIVMACRWPVVCALCLVVNAADTIEVAWRTFPSVPASLNYPQTPALTFLQGQSGLFRVVSDWNFETEFPTARPNLLLPYHLDDVRVYESLVPKNPLFDHGDWNGLNCRFFVRPPTRSSPARDWPLVYHGEVNIYENPHVLPRVEYAGGRVVIEHYVSGSIRLKVDSAGGGRLLVRERAYPGWIATVDQKTSPWHETDGMWMAMRLSAGPHVVTLSYRPATVRCGATITLIALLLALTLACRKGQSSPARSVLG